MTEPAQPDAPVQPTTPVRPATSPPTAPALAPCGTGPIRAVLLDADGVLQLIGTPWRQALAAAGGEDFAEALLSGEDDALSGRETLRELLGRLREQLGIAPSVEELMELWWRATPDPAARAVVAELRAAGYATALTTNQQHERRDWMRHELAYDGLCDLDAYSCTLGLCKPDPAYFRAVLELLGLRPEQALFVDDSARNIAAASALGLATIHHPADSGGAVLRAELLAVLGSAEG